MLKSLIISNMIQCCTPISVRHFIVTFLNKGTFRNWNTKDKQNKVNTTDIQFTPIGLPASLQSQTRFYASLKIWFTETLKLHLRQSIVSLNVNRFVLHRVRFKPGCLWRVISDKSRRRSNATNLVNESSNQLGLKDVSKWDPVQEAKQSFQGGIN